MQASITVLSDNARCSEFKIIFTTRHRGSRNRICPIFTGEIPRHGGGAEQGLESGYAYISGLSKKHQQHLPHRDTENLPHGHSVSQYGQYAL